MDEQQLRDEAQVETASPGDTLQVELEPLDGETPAGATPGNVDTPNNTGALDDADALVVELTPENEEPVQPAPDTVADDRLVVDLDSEDKASAPKPEMGKTVDFDLTNIALPDETPFHTAGKTLPGMSGGAGDVGMKTKASAPLSAAHAIAYGNLLAMTLSGILGGALGWLLTEPLQAAAASNSDLATLVQQAVLFAALVGGAIGMAIGIAAGIAVGVSRKAVSWAFSGLLWGAVGGALGGGIAQYIYGVISIDYLLSPISQLLLRATGWSIMGVFFGLAQAATVPAAKKMRNGIIGGALGGLLGGMAFQLILNASAHSGSLGRLLALCAMGAAIGILLGLVEEVAKEAWLRVIAGPLTGKQFILYEERTVIGSHPSCAIMLFKDPQVAPEHAEIRNERTDYALAGLTPGAPVTVNGQFMTRRNLQDGDVIGIGATRFEFRERARENAGKAGQTKKRGGYGE